MGNYVIKNAFHNHLHTEKKVRLIVTREYDTWTRNKAFNHYTLATELI